MGVDNILVRELVKEPEKQGTLLGSALLLKVVGALSALLLLFLTLALSNLDRNTAIYISIIAVGYLFNSFTVIDSYFQSLVKSKYIVWANMASLLFSNGVKVFLICIDAPLIYFALSYVTDTAFTALAFIIVYKKAHTIKCKWFFSFQKAKDLLSKSWPLILSALMVSLYLKIDQIMIRKILDTTAVGNYSAALKVNELFYFVPVIVSATLFPDIVREREKSMHRYTQKLTNLYTILVRVGVVISFLLSLLSQQIISILYSDQFSDAAGVLQLYSWSLSFIFLGVASGKWYIAEGLEHFSFYRTLLGAIVNIILNYFTIPLYGILGAAVSTLFAQLFATYLFDLLHNKTRKQFYLKTTAIIPFLKKRIS